MDSAVLTPTDFVALLNQTLEFAYPAVTIEGELSNFRISKNRWVYFDLQDEQASIKFFGTVYLLPGPLQDGLKIRASGSPRLHPRFGFSINITSISPVGEGSIKKAADLLRAKLEAEGLFEPARKRLIPATPKSIGLITAAKSAAYADFVKIINERWGGVEVSLADVYVQGAQAPLQIVRAVEYFNELSQLTDLLVITRGGGSIEDLAAFNDERVVRAIAASRIPTLVAVGHEVDTSLAELAADQRASTPTNAAQLAVPNRIEIIAGLKSDATALSSNIAQIFQLAESDTKRSREDLSAQVSLLFKNAKQTIISNRKLAVLFDPRQALKRGYAIAFKDGRHLSSIKRLRVNDSLELQLSDGRINSKVTKISRLI